MTAHLRSRVGPAPRPPDARTPALVLIGVAAAVCLVAALVQPEHHLGLDAHAVLALASRVVAVCASAGALGCLLLCLCQPSSTAPDPGLLRSAAAWSSVWVAALVVGFAVEVTSPESVTARVAVGPNTGDIAVRFRWLVLGVALAGLVRVLCPAVRSRGDAAVVAAVAVGGLVVVTGTGHGGSLLSPTPAFLALLAHVLAASAWTGGLLALVVHVRSLEPPAAGVPTARAYSRLALVCYVVLAASGVLALLSRIGPAALLDSGSYVALVLVKTGLLLVLGVFGAAQRRSGLVRLEGGDRGTLLQLSAGELVVMGAALGLGVALAHTAA